MPSPKGANITPLMLAAFYGRWKVLKVMLKAGADVNAMNSVIKNQHLHIFRQTNNHMLGSHRSIIMR